MSWRTAKSCLSLSDVTSMVRGIVTMRFVHEYWFIVLSVVLGTVLVRGALGA